MPPRNIKNLLFYSYLNQKKLNRYNYYELLRGRDNLNKEELYRLQYIKLKNLLHHCYEKIPYYKELFKANGIHPCDIKSLEDYKKIPTLTKETIRQNHDKLLDPTLSKQNTVYDTTSGSTGIPLKIIKSIEDAEYGYALRNRSNAWCGWDFFDSSVWFVSDVRKISDINKFKGALRKWLMNRVVLNTQNTTPESMKIWVKQIQSFKPKQIYGYSSLLSAFSKFILKNNITFPSVKGVFSTAEPLQDRELISKAFNAPVYDQYGASEIPCIAHECKKGNMHVNIDEVVVEFENIKTTSEIQKMICTPLFSYGMPLLRYELGDCAVPTEKICDCGLNYPVIELKVGRVSDNLITEKGKLISGVALSWYITDATQGIEQYEIVQTKPNEVIVKTVSNEEYRNNNEKELKSLFSELFESNDINIKFEYPDKITPGLNGKYRPISSTVVEGLNKR